MRNSILIVLLGVTGCAGEAGPSNEPAAAGDELKLLKPYLALGDSVAFGYNPDDAVNHPDQIWRFNGYPEVVSLTPIPTANAACEGETSASFMDVTAPDNGCHNDWRANHHAMHVQYANDGQSQLDFAIQYLLTHPNTATVSVGVGANDLLVLQNSCTAANYPDLAKIQACIQAGAVATITQAAKNVGTILGTLRYIGYTGQLVVVTYYSMQYADRTDLNLQSIYGLDQALVAAAQAVPGTYVAKGFTAFGAISQLTAGDACKAGLLYKLANGTCDKHPSALGQATLAAAVAAAVPASSINLADPNVQF
jgi:hypothetical protein